MWEMQNPPEVNPEFDSGRYAQLIGTQHLREAEEMIQVEGGPTLEQMQRLPLDVLRKYPSMDPNWCDPKYNGCSLLQWASAMGYDEVVQGLLTRQADPNHKARSGASCLATACAQSCASCALNLLEARADPDEVIEPAGGQTLLMWASRTVYSDKDGNEAPNPFVGLLLRYACNVNAIDQRGQTALIHASTHGNVPAVEALLAASADVSKDSQGDTASAIDAVLRLAKRGGSDLLSLERSLLPPLKQSVTTSTSQATWCSLPTLRCSRTAKLFAAVRNPLGRN
ncbi:unnamed protein product [Polarella glacialis]|uniref:Uncharacterized protein n=1 Tax=Polarella glacialis TaxID=89957 RepID=A0A813J7R2_POLGL|nr:unnamed protein product [Polarella glacialis]